MASFKFELSKMGPEWFDMILCPACNHVVKAINDMVVDQESLVCPICGKEFDFDRNVTEVFPRLRIQPVPRSMIDYTLSREGGITMSGAADKRIFMYALMAWENVVDSQGKSIKLTSRLKESLFDESILGIANFVLLKVQKLQTAKGEQEKN